MASRKKHSLTEEEKALRRFYKVSSRHVLVLETDLKHHEKCKVFHYADLERKAGNELLGRMKKNYSQLNRTKKYRRLKKMYGNYATKKEKEKCREIAVELNEMQKKYRVTWEDCRSFMIPIAKKYGLDSVFALTKAEDVWRAVEKCLYSDGRTFHFAKRGDLPAIRAKQINRGIVLTVKENQLRFKFNGLSFGVQIKDCFEKEEVDAVLKYLAQPAVIDRQAVETLKEKNTCMNTYRLCYAVLVCKKIRGKMRVYLHLTIEGIAKPKQDQLGRFKHRLGKGIVGCDIGTQTIAYTSDTEVGLKNLAERGPSILENERKERILKRAMERSRRAMNPKYYNKDGTIKKGRKIWKYSKKYQKLKEKHTEFCRKNAINRHLAINEDVNHLRSLGDTFITEPKNAKKLQKRAKKTTINEKGKINRKKRFGRSIKNRCPGYFQAQVERKFKNTDGNYIEVSNDYRASQYDHTSNEYVKKKLSQRMYSLADGTVVQRDWYSSYLLYCMDNKNETINREKCVTSFKEQYQKEKKMITWIQKNHIKVLNSGIR